RERHSPQPRETMRLVVAQEVRRNLDTFSKLTMLMKAPGVTATAPRALFWVSRTSTTLRLSSAPSSRTSTQFPFPPVEYLLFFHSCEIIPDPHLSVSPVSAWQIRARGGPHPADQPTRTYSRRRPRCPRSGSS